MGQGSRMDLLKLLVCLGVLLVTVSCAQVKGIFEIGPKEAPSPEQEIKPEDREPPFFHEVRWQGESLSLIAKWYTGSSKNWKALADANPDLNPNLIHIGDQILIPKRLLRTEKPMPHSFLPSPRGKKDKNTPIKEDSSEEKLELFGPKR